LLALIEVLAWGIFACLIMTNSGRIIGFALQLIYGEAALAPAEVMQNLIYVSPSFPLFLGFLAVVRLKALRINIGELIGFSWRKLPTDLLVGTIVGVASVGVSLVSLRFLSHYVETPRFDLLPPQVHWYFTTVGALVPGFCEELYFRGMMVRVGRDLPRWLIVVLTAAAFAAWHIGAPVYLLHTFLLGLGWGTLVIVTGRLAPAIIAHTAANAGFGLLLLSGVRVA
jgi:membrane protease YdiL (CAAX protease family)